VRVKTRTVTLGLGHACCTGAACAHGEVRTERELDRLLEGGGRELVLRGARASEVKAIGDKARAAGFARVVLATAALDRHEAIEGVDAVRAVIFSHRPAVHDRIAGRQNALALALVGMRALRIPIELEVPLLSAKLSDADAIVELALRALGSLGAVCFVSPSAPGRYDEITLARAVARAIESGARVELTGVPPCAVAPEHRSFALTRDRRDRALTSACEGCAAACGGPTRAYASAHGAIGLTTLTEKPRPRHRPAWGASEREAARDAAVLVLRPTVHCNQDCLFCSANESSGNAFTDPKRMLRAIARAAQRGVKRVSFSGGEPTLSPHLAEFVAAAKRAGVPEVELVTNGVLLDRKARVQRLADAGLTHAFVSLHAHDEAISRTLTQKDGDYPRTLAAIEHLLAANVLVSINHVITTRNEAHLATFVEHIHARFGGRVSISFAFVTPQFKALEHAELWPRLSDVMPHLHAAMHRAVELGQPFVVGARQGVPPCFLGPFAAWTDLFHIAREAASEDTPQKARGPACARCRYRELCGGLWKPYAARFGFDELAPIEGPPFTGDELAQIRDHRRSCAIATPNGRRRLRCAACRCPCTRRRGHVRCAR
jgi:MoaA/NifB/PqqE/SkfB family radical SAM enzyme